MRDLLLKLDSNYLSRLLLFWVKFSQMTYLSHFKALIFKLNIVSFNNIFYLVKTKMYGGIFLLMLNSTSNDH